jgi:hypothetical protein
MERPETPEPPWRSGLRGARANLLPGVVLQLAALALVLGYYHDPAVRSALGRVQELHEAAGFGFGIVSTALFGGVIPFLYIHVSQRDAGGRPRYGWLQGAALTAFWAYKGFEVDLWYRIQAHVVGSGHDAATIALKVFLDQFVYCPLFAVPVTAAVYQAVETHFDGKALGSDIASTGWYRRRVLAVLVANMGVWIPAVAVIYALPTPLQLPLQNIVLCFYTLVVAHQIRSAPAAAGPNPLG